MKILIIGDSNSYGWDPRDFLGRPYKKPWPVFLKDAGFEVAVDAVPGCEIPHFPQLIDSTVSMINREQPDILMLMLGSNDILNMNNPNADLATGRMKQLVKSIRNSTCAEVRIILMAIPEIRIPGGYYEAGQKYNECLRQIAKELNCDFFQYDGELLLAYDGVHLTEAGYRLLGEAAVKYIENDSIHTKHEESL